MERSLNPIPISPRRRSSEGCPAACRCRAGAAGPARLARVEGVLQLVALRLERQRPAGERGRQLRHRLLQVERQLSLAELLHQLGLLLDDDQLPLVDDADPVGHLLRLVDVVRGQDDGDAAGAQPPHERPHVAPELDVHAGGRLVEEQNLRLVRQRLGDHHPALHPPGERHDPASALVPKRQLAQHLLDVGRVGGAPKEPAAEADRRPDRLERVGGQLLRDEADPEARRAVVAHDVVAVRRHRAARRRDDAADDVDERRLAGAVRPEQREDLPLADLEIDLLERHEARGVGLGQPLDRDDRFHHAPPEIPRAFAVVEPGVSRGVARAHSGPSTSARIGEERAMSFFVGLLLFVVVVGILDAKLPWPRPRDPQRRS